MIDHYENPRNVGSMDKNDAAVGTGLVGAPACGDVMKLQVPIEDDVLLCKIWLTDKIIIYVDPNEDASLRGTHLQVPTPLKPVHNTL